MCRRTSSGVRGKAGEHLVADAQRAVVERVAAEEVGRQLDIVERVHVEKALRHGARIVRRQERDVGEERLLAVAGRQVVDQGVAEELAGVHPGMDVVAVPPRDVVVAEIRRIGNVGQLLVVAAASIVVVGGHVPVVGHATEVDLVAVLEAAVERFAAVVPLAGTPGVVALGPQRLAEHGVLVRDAAAGVVQVEEGPPGVQHRPARHADRPVRAAGDVRVRECRSARHEAVDVRRVDGRAAERADGVEALVVGEEDEDVGFGHGLARCCLLEAAN